MTDTYGRIIVGGGGFKMKLLIKRGGPLAIFRPGRGSLEKFLLLNLSKMASLGTEESGHCKGVAVEVLNKSQCMDFLSAGMKKVAIVERWPLAEVRFYLAIKFFPPLPPSA